MAQEHKGIMVVKFGTQKVPEFCEVKGKDWVSFGKDNLYPDYLIKLFSRSATHNAIVTGKVNYITGEGWTYKDKGLSIDSKALIQDFVNNINPDETLNELTEKLTIDFEIFDGFCFEVIRSKNKRKLHLYYVPFSKIRTNEKESEYYYSNDWSTKNQDPEKTGYKVYPKFMANETKVVKSLFVFRILSPRAGKDANVYPIPNYIGGTQAIETEIECQNWNLAEIKSGFSAGTMLNFYNGIPTEDEKEAIEEMIVDKFSGTDAAGRIVLNFSDGKERGSEAIALNGNDLAERYLNVKKDASKAIFTSHKVSSPELFGVQEDTVFGGRTQIAEKYELFVNTYISKRQRILEGVFNKFAEVQGVPQKLMIKPTAAIGLGIPESKIAEAMSIEYVREQLGIPEPKQQVKMRNETDFEFNILEAFSKIGRPKDLFHIVKSKELKFNDEIELLESELELLKFAKEEEDKTGNIIKPIKLPKSGRIEVVYSYEWRDGFSNRDLKTSREFCKELIRRDLFYTKDEIRRLSNDFDTDVFKYKGGWYTKPDTNIHVPYCRHIWKQHVVKVK